MSPSSKRVAVIGAGIVGCAIAYELRKRGLAVTLIDRDAPGQGCSFGNSGAISPASIVPLAMPGILKTVPGMMMDPESPLFLPLGYLPQATPWLMRFVASATPEGVANAAKRLASLHGGATELHRQLTQEVGVPELFLQQGHLHLYPDDAALAKDATGWRMREAFGFKLDRLDRGSITDLEPLIGERYQIGIFLADHGCIVNPFRYVQAIARAYANAGGKMLHGDVQSIRQDRGQWQVCLASPAEPVEFDELVVATGAWSKSLLKPLGITLHVESQRGYHVQFDGYADTIQRTVVLADRKIFMTPMEEGLRVGGTVEIGGLTREANERRAAILARIAQENFPRLQSVPMRSWMGHRPCMPDSVPVVGAAEGHPGLWIAVGHGHLGLTDSVTTAKKIGDLIDGAVSQSVSSLRALTD